MWRSSWLFAVALLITPSLAAATPKSAPVEQFGWSFSSSRGRLGVVVESLTPELRSYFGVKDDRGLLVAHVEPSSLAASAGIRVGDVITAVRGRPVDSAVDVLSAIEASKKGDDIAVVLVRDHEEVTVHALLGDVSPDTGSANSQGNHGMRSVPPEFQRMLRDMMQHWSCPEMPPDHNKTT